ncbi:MAG TPA: hypothetical protein VER03_08850 [Bryobacteraceae bacterium]|nr:hypothetical protein [Bryobacteraceae bacterium]
MQGQISDMWTVNASTVNEFRSSIVRQVIRNTPSTLGRGYPANLGIRYALADVFPSVNIGGAVGNDSVGPGTSAVLGATSSNGSNSRAGTWFPNRRSAELLGARSLPPR